MGSLTCVSNNMPHKRYNKRVYKRKSNYMGTAARALSLALAVKKLVNVEYKTVTVTFPVDPNSTGSVTNLSAIAQGNDIANRQGNKIRAKYLSVAGNVSMHASATESQLRLMIVRDNLGTTAQPAIADLFTDVGVFRSGRNKLGDPQSNSRFSILWDKYILLDAINNTQVKINWSSSLDHHIYYDASAATDEGKGNVYLFLASDQATNDPILVCDSMLKFIDN